MSQLIPKVTTNLQPQTRVCVREHKGGEEAKPATLASGEQPRRQWSLTQATYLHRARISARRTREAGQLFVARRRRPAARILERASCRVLETILLADLVETGLAAPRDRAAVPRPREDGGGVAGLVGRTAN